MATPINPSSVPQAIANFPPLRLVRPLCLWYSATKSLASRSVIGINSSIYFKDQEPIFSSSAPNPPFKRARLIVWCVTHGLLRRAA